MVLIMLKCSLSVPLISFPLKTQSSADCGGSCYSTGQTNPWAELHREPVLTCLPSSKELRLLHRLINKPLENRTDFSLPSPCLA